MTGGAPCSPYPSDGGIEIMRRPPSCIPAIPFRKPGMTPSSGKLTGWPPRPHDESNSEPLRPSTPTYCTRTVCRYSAVGPEPTTRSCVCRNAGLTAPSSTISGLVSRSSPLGTDTATEELLCSVDLDEVDDEDQRLVGADERPGALSTVRLVGRDDDLPSAALLHADDAVAEAGDDVAEREGRGLPAVPGGVELLGVARHHPDVLDRHRVRRLGLLAVADDEVLGLQLGRRDVALRLDERALGEIVPVEDLD